MQRGPKPYRRTHAATTPGPGFAYYVARASWCLWAALSLCQILFLGWCLMVVERSKGQALHWARLHILNGLVMLITLFSYEGWRFFFVVAGRDRPHLRLGAVEVPGVDIIITCCGEDRAVVMNTVRAACCLHYPPAKFQVILSDDRADKLLEGEVQDLRQKYKNLSYHARTKPSNTFHGAKAGNANSAVNFAATKTDSPNEWVVVMDADMIAEKHILHALLPHGISSPDVGLVASGQHYYNVPVNDPLCQTMEWYNKDQELMDSVHAGNCFGTGFIIRRKVLAEIGGFPYSIADDVLCSMLLEQRGWKTAVINEKVQWGLVPNSAYEHLVQRRKWNAGNMNNTFQLKFCLGPSRMTLQQRLLGFCYCVRTFSYMIHLFGYCTMLLSVLNAVPLIVLPNSNYLPVLVVWCMTVSILRYTYELTISSKYGYRILRREHSNHLWLATHITISGLKELRAILLGGRRMPFTATNSIASRLRLNKGGKWTSAHFADEGIRLNAALHIAVMTGVVLYSVLRSCSKHHDLRGLVQDLFINALWPGNEWLVHFTSFAIVLLHARPRTEEPQRLLDEDEDGVLRPRMVHREPKWNNWSWALEIPRVLSLLQSIIGLVVLIG